MPEPEIHELTLKCYAEGRPARDGSPGRWEAVCLDFDIAVQGESMSEVMESLEDAIRLYLETVAELPPEEHRAFLRRKAPLPMHLKFFWHAFRITFWGGGRGGQKGRAEFTLPCHA